MVGTVGIGMVWGHPGFDGFHPDISSTKSYALANLERSIGRSCRALLGIAGCDVLRESIVGIFNARKGNIPFEN